MPNPPIQNTTRQIVREPGNGTLELFPLPTDEATLESLLRIIFERFWREIVFGILIQGSVFEMTADAAPSRVGMLDGYLTVEFDRSHFHICIGEHKGEPGHPVGPDVATHRRTARAELYRRLDADDQPISWGLRLFNGHDEQQLSVFLPNPFLDDDAKPRPPRWRALALWNTLRRDYLGLAPDPIDRTAKRFVHDA